MKMLGLVLLLSLDAYKEFQRRKIPLQIFIGTFACLPRFLDESKSFTANTVSTEPFGSTANLLQNSSESANWNTNCSMMATSPSISQAMLPST